ncbi:phosphopantothenoylcysteine decarboxylase [Geosmithia morbida]|uniref:Phosphopantothenoylcysteine decarboxylase n=1 Tax=Geosmithia morbida TaxID=1094350 RepID=A0A9P5D1S5_9HYPO|nr:phosphopantothenoylcysteine decarboxylase [Geosmithia morbida]KAF4120095.1 phosphopantothenoylcysteine decarboxylase [Geosmithia morbida]
MSLNGRDDSADSVVQARSDGKRHLLLAATGSVATIKIFQIVKALSTRDNLSIRLVFTPSAARFLDGQSAEQPSLAEIARFRNVDAIYNDASEWTTPWTRGSPVLHIELRKWADLMVIAPLSANSMAKMITGICDSLLLSVVRAWDTTGFVDGTGNLNMKRKIVVAPAMNTCMWRHPITARQIKTLEEDWGGDQGWVEVIRPIEKPLACGDVGDGAMASFETIVSVIDEKLGF